MNIQAGLHQLYVRTIAQVIWFNEAISFYPKLKSFYRSQAGQIDRPPLILDIGANRGQSIHFFRQLFADAIVHSFEPNIRLFKKMQQWFENEKDIFLYNKGVSNKNGQLTFYENVLDETSSFEPTNPDSDYLKKKSRVLLVKPGNINKAKYEVAVTTLDEFVAVNNIQTIDILKVDVEGHEWEVLQGASETLSAKKVRLLQLEEHADDQYQNEGKNTRNLLRQLGYVELHRIKHGFGNFFEVIYSR